MTPVRSSVIAEAGHDGASTLTIKFHNGESHRYHRVHKATFDTMMRSPSVGRYFTRYIRPHYRSTKVS